MVALVLMFLLSLLSPVLSGCPGVQAAMAQFVIENSGSLQDTHEQVRRNKESTESFQIVLSQVLRIHGNLSKSFFHWKVRLLLGAAIGGLFGIAYLVSKKVNKQPKHGSKSGRYKKPKPRVPRCQESTYLFGWDSPV